MALRDRVIDTRAHPGDLAGAGAPAVVGGRPPHGLTFDLRRVLALSLTGLLLVVVGVEFVVGFRSMDWGLGIGNDYRIYMDGANRWLNGSGFYLDRQLHGPYPIEVGDVLYPPTALWFFAAATLLPAPFWWLIPIGVLSYLVVSWRPARWAWPLIAAGLAWPNTPLAVVTGNPVLWITLAVGAGLRWRWPGALVLLKPSVFPFALIGMRSRTWWLAVAVLAIATLPLLPMVPDWSHAVFDGRGWGGLLYSLRDIPLLLLPVWAWYGRRSSGGLAVALLLRLDERVACYTCGWTATVRSRRLVPWPTCADCGRQVGIERRASIPGPMAGRRAGDGTLALA